ncbi:LTA synthase family protein [Haloferax larsenii]|nr:LTA synthase family protein [Haloferax larsenii]
MDGEWDNLFILDACRADLFEEVANLDFYDSYRRVTSLGSTTEEWTRNNFGGEQFGDTVYLTSNPYTTKVAGDSFFELINVWADSFDEETATVYPEPMIDAALEANQKYPDKRLIVHFMQPHYPFVGSDTFVGAGMNPKGVMEGTIGGDKKQTAWRALAEGEVTGEEVWEAYSDNLRLVLDPVNQLAEELDGLSVVTSDHGNMRGERTWPVPIRVFGHPGGLRDKELIEVPWAVLEGERRRRIKSGGVNLAEEDKETINSRLRELGYDE